MKSDEVNYPEWPSRLTRAQAIAIIDAATDKDDPYWSDLVDDYYDEPTDTMPTLFHVLAALGVTAREYKEATGADNVPWPRALPGGES